MFTRNMAVIELLWWPMWFVIDLGPPCVMWARLWGFLKQRWIGWRSLFQVMKRFVPSGFGEWGSIYQMNATVYCSSWPTRFSISQGIYPYIQGAFFSATSRSMTSFPSRMPQCRNGLLFNGIRMILKTLDYLRWIFWDWELSDNFLFVLTFCAVIGSWNTPWQPFRPKILGSSK